MKIDANTRFEELPQFISAVEFSNFTRLSQANVYKLLKSGEIRHVRIGRAIRIAKEEVARLLETDHSQN